MNTKKTISQKIVNIILDIVIFIFSLVLLVSLYTGIQTKILKKDYADFFGYSIFEVQTGSMAKTINVGDWILVQITNDVKLNDIITYKLDGNFITHRVKAITDRNTYITKGDANRSEDDPVRRDQIVGKVTKIFAKFGILRKTIFNPLVLLALIITLFTCSILFNSNSKIKKKIAQFIKNTFAKNVEKNHIVTKNKDMITNVDYNIDNLNNDHSDDKNKTIHVVNVNSEDLDNGRYNSNTDTNSDIELLKQNSNILDNDMEKTSLYRVIPVDLDEIDETYMEIAENELKNKENIVKKDIKIVKDIEITNKDIVNIDLDLLDSNKSRKSKNIIDKAINIKIEEIEELTNILNSKDKNINNISTIKSTLINTYVSVKYYNYYEDIIFKYSSNDMNNRVIKILKVVGKKMKNSYKGSDIAYNDKIDKYVNLFTLICTLDEGRETIDDIKIKKDYFENEILESLDYINNNQISKIVDKVIKTQNDYDGALEYFMKKLETSTFKLEFDKIIYGKDIYTTRLEHSINFSKVYSDYIIDKTYNEGVVAEDKILVLLTMLLSSVINDMLVHNFNKNYLVYLPNSIYNKEKKLVSLLKMIDNEYAKNNIVFLIEYKDAIKNIELIKKYSKLGYSFSILFSSVIDMDDNHINYLHLFKYILVEKNIESKKILSQLPKELKNKAIIDDIINKFDDIRSE